MNYIFSFDISTTCIGWCIAYEHQETGWITYHRSGFLQLDKQKSVLQRAEQFRDLLLELNASVRHEFELPLSCSPAAIWIEAPKQGFAGSSAQIRHLLQGFNSTCQWLCFDLFNVEPQLIAEATVRAGIVSRGQSRNQKHQMGEYIAEHCAFFPEDHICRKSTGILKDTTLDEMDATAIVLWLMRKSQNQKK